MTTATALPRKESVYDCETRDYAMYLDGELGRFARTYHEAEITLDQLVFELISGHFGVQSDSVPVKPIHVTTYTVVLSEPSEAYTYTVRHPSGACASKTTNRSAQGEVIIWLLRWLWHRAKYATPSLPGAGVNRQAAFFSLRCLALAPGSESRSTATTYHSPSVPAISERCCRAAGTHRR